MSLLTRLPKARSTARSGAVIADDAAQFVDNLIVCRDGRVWAFYRLAGVRWDYTGTDAQAGLIESSAALWSALDGKEFTDDVTAFPHPTTKWAANLDARNPSPAPDVHLCAAEIREKMPKQMLDDGECGCETWNKYLIRMQRRIKSMSMDDKVVVRGFLVGRVPAGLDVRSALHAFMARGTAMPEPLRKVFAEEKRVARTVEHRPWSGRRATVHDLVWLRKRSLARHIPSGAISATVANRWASNDVEAPTDERWIADPDDRWVQMVAWREGERHERYAQALILADENDLSYPASSLEPWMVYAERLPFPVDWHVAGRILAPEDLLAEAELNLKKAVNIHKGYAEHDEIPPGYVEDGIGQARRTRDQVSKASSNPVGAKRFRGSVIVVITGETAEEVEHRSEDFRALYATPGVGMMFDVVRGQWEKIAECVPGARRDAGAYQRQWDLHFMAAAMPNVNASVGDGVGPYYGFTMGATRRPHMHDSHYATEGREHVGRGQNLWIALATLGGGKSVLLNQVIYHGAKARNRVVVRDPSGPLANLATLPDIAPLCRVINMLEGQDGTASIPALIREPRRTEFVDGEIGDEKYRRAVIQAAGERRRQTTDLARRMLDWDLYSHKETRDKIRRAARQVTWSADTSMFDLVNALDVVDAKDVADALRDKATEPGFSLLFAPAGQGGDYVHAQSDRPVTFITTPGLKRAPDNVDRSDWTPEEIAADVLLRVSGLFTNREIFGKTMSERAIAVFDEAEDMTDTGTGRGTLTRLGRDHSKWNIEVWLALKALDSKMMGGGLSNFVAGAYVGRMASVQAAESVMDLVRLEDRRYARMLTRLSDTQPGQFVHLDADGNVGGVQIDVGWNPALYEVAMTNPGDGSASEAWKRVDTLG